MNFEWIRSLGPWGLAGILIGLMAVAWVKPTTGEGSILIILIVFSVVTLLGFITRFTIIKITKRSKKKSTIKEDENTHKKGGNGSKVDFFCETKPSSTKKDSNELQDK